MSGTIPIKEIVVDTYAVFAIIEQVPRSFHHQSLGAPGTELWRKPGPSARWILREIPIDAMLDTNHPLPISGYAAQFRAENDHIIVINSTNRFFVKQLVLTFECMVLYGHTINHRLPQIAFERNHCRLNQNRLEAHAGHKHEHPLDIGLYAADDNLVAMPIIKPVVDECDPSHRCIPLRDVANGRFRC